jgi:methanethiol S-methyltransferase
VFNWEYFSQFLPLVFSLFAYAIIHSVLASPFAKNAFEKLLSNYRLFFNAVAVITLLGPLYFYINLKPSLIIDFSFLKIPGLLISLYCLWVMKQSFKNYSLYHFLGFKKNNSTIAPNLVVDGWNKKVRHPLYFGSLMLIWGWFLVSPTDKYLLLSAVLTLYFFIGVRFEERRLVKEFGNAYKEYQQNVPLFIPRLGSLSFAFFAIVFSFGCSTENNDLKPEVGLSDSILNPINLTTFNEIPETKLFDSVANFSKTKPRVELIQITIGDSTFQVYGFNDFAITKSSFLGSQAFKSLYSTNLDKKVKTSLTSISKLMEEPKLMFENYQTTSQQLKESYQKTFLKKDTSSEMLFNAKLLAFQVQASNLLLQNWSTDSVLINQNELQQKFIKSINQLDPNFIYDDIIYASLASMLTSKPQDDSLKFEALNNRLNSIQELGLNQQAKKIFHFRVLVDYLVNLNNSAIELEKTYNYKFLASPVFYKKLNEIQSIISSQIEENLVIEADSTAFDSLAPIQ